MSCLGPPVDVDVLDSGRLACLLLGLLVSVEPIDQSSQVVRVGPGWPHLERHAVAAILQDVLGFAAGIQEPLELLSQLLPSVR